MSTDLIPAEPSAVSPYLALMERMADKGMTPEHLGKVLDLLEERWQKNRAAQAFADAITAFQERCPPVMKLRTAKIPSGRDGGREWSYQFAGFDDIMKVIGPLLAELRIVVTFSCEQGQGASLKTTCRVRVGTHVEEHTLTVPVPSQMVVNDTQKYGAALSYAKRYALCAALNIVVTGEDSDAKGLLDTINAEQVAQIERLLEEKKVDRARFMDWLLTATGGAESIEQIPAAKFPSVFDALKRKKGA